MSAAARGPRERQTGRAGRVLVLTTGTAVLATAAVVAPVAALPAPAAHPVEPTVHRIAVPGTIDQRALGDPTALDVAAGHEPGTGVLRAPATSSVDGQRHVERDAAGPGASGTSSGTGEAGGELAVLGVKTLTAHFLVGGVTWEPGGPAVTEVDARLLEDGTWSEWFTLTVDDLGVSGERPGTDAMVTGGADGVQVRLVTADGTAPSDVRVDVVDPGTSAADATVGAGLEPAAPAASAQASTGYEIEPTIVTRAQWGADESRGSDWPQVSSRLQAMYVHHTVGTNDYSRSQSAAIVRGVYAFHTGSRGWPDIGYQFLVDRYGTIYQGRRDAIHDNPIGAQAGGYNSVTIGVSAMGNFESGQPTSALLTGIERVLAWKAYEYGLNPTGRTTLTTGSSTGSVPRHAPGTRVSVPVILGHRDTNGTACPGRYLYAKLPTIRAAVASRVAAAKRTYGMVRYTTAAPTVVAPTADQSPVQWSSTTTYRWKAVSGAARYQLLTRVSSRGNRTDLLDDRYWTVYKTVTGTAATVSTGYGDTRLVAVRAVDTRGRLGPPSTLSKATRPVASSSVARAGTWTTSGGGWATTSSGARLSVSGLLDVRQVVVRARTGPGTGPIEVRAGSARLGVLDPSTLPTSSDRALVLPLASPVSGTISVVALDGRSKHVLALAFPRTVGHGVGVSRTARPAAPASTLTSAARSALGTSRTFTWRAVTGASRYEVWSRAASGARALPGTWTYRGSTTHASYALATSTAGATYQVRVRAVGAGGSGATTQLPSVTTPVAWSQVVQTGGWSRSTSSLYLRGGAYVTTAAGARLRVSGPTVGRVRLHLTTAPGQGRLSVLVGGHRVATLWTSSTSTRWQTFLDVRTRYHGTVEVRTLDRRPVRISAVVLLRS